MGPSAALSSVLAFSIILASSIQTASSANICLEQVSSAPGIWMQEHPVGNSMVVGLQNGLLQIMPIPAIGANGTVDASSTIFLDLTSRTLFQENSEAGLLGFTFHPDFLSNGRFFVSYICNGTATPDCNAPCGCTGDGCDPASCVARTVVSEYSAGSNPAQAKSIAPAEVRKIIAFGRPSISRNGGQIWFGPDKYLYYASGDGGINSTAQNGSLPFGKILRVDVDTVAPAKWGNYSIPADNPFRQAAAYAEEVYALGFRNPWRCSYDSVSGTTVCGDVGENTFEEVNVLQSSGNYGWPKYEGNVTTPTLGPNSFVVAAAPVGYIQPVLEYPHNPQAYTSIIGGYVYRGNASPCLRGMYVFGDSNGSPYVGTLPQLGSTAQFENSTIAVARGKKIDNLDFPAYSWATDLANNLYRMSASGIYRVVNASQCNLSCGYTKLQAPTDLSSSTPPKAGANQFSKLLASSVFHWTLACLLVFMLA